MLLSISSQQKDLIAIKLMHDRKRQEKEQQQRASGNHAINVPFNNLRTKRRDGFGTLILSVTSMVPSRDIKQSENCDLVAVMSKTSACVLTLDPHTVIVTHASPICDCT